MDEQEIREQLAKITASDIIFTLLRMWPERLPFAPWRWKMLDREYCQTFSDAVAKLVAQYPEDVDRILEERGLK